MDNEADNHTRSSGFSPRISVPGVIDPVFPPPKPEKDPYFVSARTLVRRLQAIKSALDDLPRHAKRFARWNARLKLGPLPMGKRTFPFRPGFPPGHRKRPNHDADRVLKECHWLAHYAYAHFAVAADTS